MTSSEDSDEEAVVALARRTRGKIRRSTRENDVSSDADEDFKVLAQKVKRKKASGKGGAKSDKHLPSSDSDDTSRPGFGALAEKILSRMPATSESEGEGSGDRRKRENDSSQKAVPIRTPSRVSSDASTKSDHGSFYINDESAANKEP